MPGATLADLDPAAVDAAGRRFGEHLIRAEPDSGRHEALRAEAATWDVETLLNKAHITKQGRITLSALLLLGRDEAAHFLSPADTKISWILRKADNDTPASLPFGPPFLLAT
jgi:ATP-dependent DNA helicase RecG